MHMQNQLLKWFIWQTADFSTVYDSHIGNISYRVHTHFDISDSRTFQDLPMSNLRTFSMNSRTLNAPKIHRYFGRSVMTEFMYACVIRNIDLYVQIPDLSRTSTKIPGLKSKFSIANPVMIWLNKWNRQRR